MAWFYLLAPQDTNTDTMRRLMLGFRDALTAWDRTLVTVGATEHGDEEERHLAIIAHRQAQHALEDRLGAIDAICGQIVTTERLELHLVSKGVRIPWLVSP